MDKIEQIPLDLSSMQEQINECLNIYNILEDYNFKFPNKDLDKRWEIFGSPKSLMELCEKIEKDLQKEKKKFHEGQVANQEEFGQNIDAL